MAYCLRCRKEVIPVYGKIKHPDIGITDAKVCPDCGAQIHPEIQPPENKMEVI